MFTTVNQIDTKGRPYIEVISSYGAVMGIVKRDEEGYLARVKATGKWGFLDSEEDAMRFILRHTGGKIAGHDVGADEKLPTFSKEAAQAYAEFQGGTPKEIKKPGALRTTITAINFEEDGVDQGISIKEESNRVVLNIGGNTTSFEVGTAMEVLEKMMELVKGYQT